jgi:hypothetical protein
MENDARVNAAALGFSDESKVFYIDLIIPYMRFIML